MLYATMNTVKTRAIIGFTQLLATLGAALFAPGWTFCYGFAWVYLALFGTSTALIFGFLWAKDPALLQRRVKAGPRAEATMTQKWIQTLAATAFLSELIVPSLDHRFAWSRVPYGAALLGDALVCMGLWIIFTVFRANSFAAAGIAIAPDQRVVSTGPYRVVRHPMYSGALVMLFGTPIALGSLWGLVPFALMSVVLAWRLLDEERFLAINLPGYESYLRTVHYRLIPRVW
jgi:protein-S-isoprenylcysteine O-methyltransferase Ste14